MSIIDSKMTAAHTMSEHDLEQAVVDLAHMLKWRVAHFRAARVRDGWKTPVSYDGAGWPDLVLVRDRLIVAELKSARGRISADQQDWLHALGNAGVERHVWRPREWVDGTVERVLRRRAIGSGR